MPLTKLHVINICKKDQGSDRCRYLEEDQLYVGIYQCLKLSSQRNAVDEEVEDLKKNSRYMSRNSNNTAVGDNCKGYPTLRYKQVGYDKNPD